MQRAVAMVLVALAAPALAVACDDDDSAAEGSGGPSTTVEVPPGPVGVESVGPPVEIPEDVGAQVLGAVRTYVSDGVVRTLREGAPGELGAVFDDAALAQLDTESGAELLDRGVPEATGDVRAVAEPVALVGLADGAGTIVLISARLDLEVVAETESGELTVSRVGDLTFAPAGERWEVTAFRILVARDGAGLEETTEATSP